MTRFDEREYGFWFVCFVDRLRLGCFGGAIVAGLVPYLLGLVLVAPFGDAGLYLRTPAFYIGLGGVALVMGAAVRGVEILAAGLSELQEVTEEPQRFHDYADHRLEAAAKSRVNLGLLAVVFAGAVALVAGALHRWDESGIVHAGPQFRAFPLEWRSSDALLPAGLALSVFAVVVTATFGSSAILLVRNLVFSWRLRRFRYMPFPGRVRLSIRRLVSAYVWVSGTWAVGVALFALFFFGNWSGLSVAGIAVLVWLGLLTLAIPYSTFRKILDDTHDQMAGLLAREVEPMFATGAGGLTNISELVEVNAAITADPPPVLTRRGAIAYGVVQVVALSGIFTKDALQEQVTFLAREPPEPAGPTSK